MWTLIILLLSLLLSMMRFITGFTCPPTIYFKFITKCDKYYYKVRQLLLLQSATAFLLQSTTSVITKYDRHYKVWQFYYKVRRLLQSATVHKYTRLSDHLNKRSRWLTRINQSTYVVRSLRTQAFSSRVLLQTISASLSGWKSQPPLQLIKQSLKQLITTELRAIFLLKKKVWIHNFGWYLSG